MNAKYINSEVFDLSKTAAACADEYKNSDPFPNISFKNFFNPEKLDQILDEFPDLSKEESSTHFDKPKEKNLQGSESHYLEKKQKILCIF